ncbi:HEPN family nuclease [Empedobacter brevis]|uniref:HEPN family nuclease n=1 Tax=Empedobacter brevis TaxID=247 RepID=UPI0028D89046|nr:HEPN family nuclease [Empedobacter brevis]
MEIIASEFHIEIIERTQNLIKNYNGESEFTLLVNCLFSMIIIPNEYNKTDSLNYLQSSINQINSITEIISSQGFIFTFNPTHYDKSTQSYVSSDKTFGCFLKKLRNAISHLNTTPINSNEKWESIRFKDINVRNKNNIELDITLNYNQIKEIALYISNEFQREVLGL